MVVHDGAFLPAVTCFTSFGYFTLPTGASTPKEREREREITTTFSHRTNDALTFYGRLRSNCHRVLQCRLPLAVCCSTVTCTTLPPRSIKPN